MIDTSIVDQLKTVTKAAGNMEMRIHRLNWALQTMVDQVDHFPGWFFRASGFKDTIPVNIARDVLKRESRERGDITDGGADE